MKQGNFYIKITFSYNYFYGKHQIFTQWFKNHFHKSIYCRTGERKIYIAIYHFNVKIVSRGKGASAVAKAAYISGEKIKNEYDEVIHDYRKKREVVHKEIMLPNNAPQYFKKRSVLWNAVEKSETRKNSQTARHINVALPIEISRDEQIDLVRKFCLQCFISRGMCADFAIHDKDDGNPHVHILLTTRKVDESGFTQKERSWNDKTLLLEWRKSWADWCNHKLYFVSKERIDHRSYAAQGINKIPQKHLGAAACAIEKKGYRTDKGSYNRKIILENTNAEIEKLNFELSALNTEKRSLKKEIIETELGCPLSETFGIEVDNISNAEDFISRLNRENILHTIKTKNDGKKVIFFSNRDKEKVSDIFYDNSRNKSVKKHRSR
ncbi:MAG: MobA/MobL family protein [Oscillospiraceae bacterium]